MLALTAEEFRAAAERLRRQGKTIEGVRGQLKHDRIELVWHYVDPILAVDVLKKPFWMSDEMAAYAVWQGKGE